MPTGNQLPARSCTWLPTNVKPRQSWPVKIQPINPSPNESQRATDYRQGLASDSLPTWNQDNHGQLRSSEYLIIWFCWFSLFSRCGVTRLYHYKIQSINPSSNECQRATNYQQGLTPDCLPTLSQGNLSRLRFSQSMYQAKPNPNDCLLVTDYQQSFASDNLPTWSQDNHGQSRSSEYLLI